MIPYDFEKGERGEEKNREPGKILQLLIPSG